MSGLNVRRSLAGVLPVGQIEATVAVPGTNRGHGRVILAGVSGGGGRGRSTDGVISIEMYSNLEWNSEGAESRGFSCWRD